MNEPLPPPRPYRRLSRPRTDRMVAGVCAGVARYLGVDATGVRIGYAVVVILTWGAALLAYPVLWVLMPEDPLPPD